MKLFNIHINRDGTLEQIRLQLIYAILFILIALGLPTIIIAGIEAYILQQYSSILIYLIFFTPIVIVAIFRKRLNYKLIAGTVISFGFLLALSNIVVYGIGGAGIPIFFSLFSLTTIIFSQRAGLFLILFSGILMCIIGYLYITNIIALDVSLDAISTKPISWLTALAVLIFLGASIVLSFGLIQSKMLLSIQIAHENSEKLKETNTQLVNDIQNRINTEKRLQESENLLLEAQLIAKLGNWEFFSLTSELKVSKTCYTILELEENIPANQLFDQIKNRIRKDDLTEYSRIIQTALKKDESFTLNYKHDFNNVIKYIECIGKPIKDNSGNFAGFQGIINDITKHKLDEEKIKELNAVLEHKINAKTMEINDKTKDLLDSQIALVNIVEDLNEKSNMLETSTIRLQHSNKELEAFSYSVSHDLRAPLRGINGFTQILMDDYSDKIDPEFKRLCNIIQGNSHKMGQLIDDLLAFSRLSHSDLRTSDIDMEKMVESTFSEVIETADAELKGRIKLKTDEIFDAKGDPVAIKQVWTNLFSNAIKFSSIRDKILISVTCEIDNNKIIYCISDNGAGFDMKYADKLFGIFQRLHSTKEYEGTGVGLAIVQRIVLRHGGQVWAEGQVNKGAKFYFSLLSNNGGK